VFMPSYLSYQPGAFRADCGEYYPCDCTFCTSQYVQRCIGTTKNCLPDYWANCLAQRAELSGKAAGSVYLGVSPSELEEMLLKAEWKPYFHPAIRESAAGFKAAIPGRLGVVRLADLPLDAMVTLDDRKNTGKVSAVVKGILGPEVDFTVLIIGLHEGEEVVFTFHPGDPVRPSQVQTEPGMHGRQVTVSEAIKMGLETAKVG